MKPTVAELNRQLEALPRSDREAELVRAMGPSKCCGEYPYTCAGYDSSPSCLKGWWVLIQCPVCHRVSTATSLYSRYDAQQATESKWERHRK